MITLMCKDKPVLQFVFDKGKVQRVGEIENESLLPVPLLKKVTLDNLHEFLGSRYMPEKREGLEEVKKMFGNVGYEYNRQMFSLSDQYWIKSSEDETWEKMNMFDNPYSEEYGKAFFSFWDVDQEKMKDRSPDITTNGVLRKRWTRGEDGKSYLIKAASFVYHQEPLSEVLSSIMLGKLNLLPFVPYELVIEGMRLCSKCPNFVDRNTEFVPAASLFKMSPKPDDDSDFTHILKMCDELEIDGAEEFLNRMIICDHITCNFDRHLGNFGFLRSADTGKFIGFAPLFDCGSAYWGKRKTVSKNPNDELFGDAVHDKALLYGVKNDLLKSGKTTDEMRDLIQQYPKITKEKANAIIQMADERDLEIERLMGKEAKELER